MAEIPVKRREGVPLWLVPVALIAIVCIGALAYTTMVPTVSDSETVSTETRSRETNTNNENGVTTTTTQERVVTDVNTARIVSVNTFAETADKPSLIGREVYLENVPVARVLSDRMFTVVSGNTEFYALLDSALDSAGGNESNVVVKAGQSRSLVGTFKDVPSADLKEEQATDLPLDSQEYKQVQNEQVYLHVTQLSN